ncbi:MAG: hypothetical protein Q7S19_03230 [bacterium]|nr:hypothetical protein [bacterium]
MNVKRAVEILDEDSSDPSKKNGVLGGLQILKNYYADLDEKIDLSEAGIFVGDFDMFVLYMSEEEVREMGKFGWIYHEDDNGWMHV